ncbi:MAG: NUDIX domain-containing protein [Patescibacteria group bacterium]|nr:NUDIX domain-containing protein [Patescibacteria group bacterium]MDD4610625.1 NUDIX domain-containing protein [Patescibacteria group bacterium]
MNSEIENKNLQEAIVRAIAFFDLFNYPLTPLEIWKFIDVKCELGEVLDIFEAAKSVPKPSEGFGTLNGFYFLPGREKIVETRIKQYNLANEKYKIAEQVAKKLKYINGIKMVAVCNNFYYRPESDIDLFIITSAKRLWLTRFLVTITVWLMGKWRHGGKIANRICLSFYASEEEMNLEKLALTPDPYFYYWLAILMPIYGEEYYQKFWQANEWLKKFLPNSTLFITNNHRLVKDNNFSLVFKKIKNFWWQGRIGNFLEALFKKIQEKKMQKNISSVAKFNDSRVVISDTILKFHEKDRREEYRNLYNVNLSLVKHYKQLPKFPDGRIDYSNSDNATVLNCFLKHRDKILLLKRSNEVRAYQGIWNSIGGYFDEFKPYKEKVLEEIFEETGIGADNISEFKIGAPASIFDAKINKTWLTVPCLVELKTVPEIELDYEHTEYRWIKPEKIGNFETTPGLERVLELLLV